MFIQIDLSMGKSMKKFAIILDIFQIKFKLIMFIKNAHDVFLMYVSIISSVML